MSILHLETDFVTNPPRPFKRGAKGTYYIRQRIAGRDCWRSLRTTHLPTANRLAVEIWRRQQSATVREVMPAAPMSADQILEAYAETEKFQLLEKNTQESRLRNFRAFARWCEARQFKYPERIGQDYAKQYLEDRKVKNKTFNNLVGELGGIFAALNRTNPFAGIPLRSIRAPGEAGSSQFKFMADDEVKTMIRLVGESGMAFRDEWQDAIRIAYYTGLRYKDVALLRFDSVNRDDGGEYIELVPAKTSKKTGGKMVHVRLVDPVRAIIQQRRRIGRMYVLPGLAAAYLKDSERSTRPLVKMLARHSFPGSFHCLRVTVATKAMRAGVDVSALGGLLGHSTESQTKAYNRAAEKIDMDAVVGGVIL